MAKTLYERDMEDSLRQIAQALGVAWEHFPDVEDLIRKAHKAGKDAERYRFMIGASPREEMCFCGESYFGKAELDAAIDAAMAAMPAVR